MFNFQNVSESLSKTTPTDVPTGVSFCGKSLKLNSEEDANLVVDAIKKCSSLSYLNLEGNTLGPDAAKAVSKALETHGKPLTRALWKDMFTGRMKTEIPKALEYLGTGLKISDARLFELDLSDNAFGPIGVEGLAALLSSSPCFTLKELRLNNNGLGISGGKMLADALINCHNNSSKIGKPLALKVFIAGRNRLENEGAKALANVFDKLGSLEEVVMPQNGIYHIGVAAIASALSNNPNLKILNLNDNTVGPKGAIALANALKKFKNLEIINLGDCLLKTRGAITIADALGIPGSHTSLIEINLTGNEIRSRAAKSLVNAVTDKIQLTSLQLDANSFGGNGIDELKEALDKVDKLDVLGSLEDDATDDEDESDEDEDDNNESDDDSNNDDDDNDNKYSDISQEIIIQEKEKIYKPINVKEFLKAPIGENLLMIEGDKFNEFLQHAKTITQEPEKYIDELLIIIMKVSSLCGSGYGDVRVEAETLTDKLYSELFTFAQSNNQLSNVNNNLLVNLALIKSEDKSSGKIEWNLEGCFKALEKICTKEYFPSLTKDALKLFIEKPIRSGKKFVDPFQDAKKSLKDVLEHSKRT